MLPVYNLDGKEVEKIQIPLVFSTPYNPRLIKRAVLAIQSHNRLPKGTDPLAGERSSSESWNTGRGISRIGRIKSHSGPRAGSAAGVAGVTGGRTPHPPVSSKNIYHKLNKKEKTSALMSAISASLVSSCSLIFSCSSDIGTGISSKFGGIVKGCFFSTKNSSPPDFFAFVRKSLVPPHELKKKLITNMKISFIYLFII